MYIGQTGRSLKHRLKEHRSALRNGDMHWQNMHSLQAMAWTSVRQGCLTATHTPQHGTCLRVGTFSIVRTSSTENGVIFLRYTRHSWTETYHSQILATSLYYAHCLNIIIHTPSPSPIILVMSKVEYYFNIILMLFIVVLFIAIIISCHPSRHVISHYLSSVECFPCHSLMKVAVSYRNV